MKKKYKRISWKTYLKDIEILGNMIEEANWHNHKIIGVLRGGCIPATILAYRFYQKPLTIDPTLYVKGDNIKDNRMFHGITISRQGFVEDDCAVLIIDELVDSGRTLNLVDNVMITNLPRKSEVKSAVMYLKKIKENHVIKPGIFVKSLPDKWIVFPYDKA